MIQVKMGDLVTELCKRAGVKHDFTTRIEIDLTEVTFRCFDENAEGRKYVSDDGETALKTVVVPAAF